VRLVERLNNGIVGYHLHRFEPKNLCFWPQEQGVFEIFGAHVNPAKKKWAGEAIGHSQGTLWLPA
jgi:hypothetical protein